MYADLSPPINRSGSTFLPDFVIRTLRVVGPRVPRLQPGRRYHRPPIAAQVVHLTATERDSLLIESGAINQMKVALDFSKLNDG